MRKFLVRIVCGLLTFTISSGLIHLRRDSKPPVTFGPAEDQSGASLPVYRCDKLPELPLPIKVLLNQNYPGWEFPEVNEDDCAAVRECGGPDAYAQLIKGDFNDDGHLDYAVLIQRRAEATDKGVARPTSVDIIAFFRKGGGYKMYPVTSEGGSDLILMRKGTTDYDYEKQREFTYPRDAIETGFGMGGMSYLYENGRFRGFVTSD